MVGSILSTCEGNFKGLLAPIAYAELLSCKLLSAGIKINVVMQITNGELIQNSSFWRAADCHCQIDELLLLSNKFKALKTL